MSGILQLLLIQWFLYGFAICDWIEIPLSQQKSFLVTPYNPYIYTPSLVFTSTTTELYETMQPLNKPKVTKSYLKKLVAKVPDVLQKTTTVNTSANSSTLNAMERHYFRNKHNPLNRDNSYTTTQSSIISESPAKYKKNSHRDYEEDDVEDGDDYEEVYDDDEDNYPDINDDESDMDLDPSDIIDDRTEKLTYDHADDDYYEEDDYEEEQRAKEKAKGNTKPNENSYVNFMPYLQNIQNTLIHNSHTDTVNDKVSFLTDIKNRLLYAIQARINSIWEPRKSRKTRSARGDIWNSWEKSEHGMEFPSNEGALLTLGFLTFAVFLIKCILKLIHAIKGKHYNKDVTQIIIQNGTAAPALNTFRFKRETFDDAEIARFMAKLKSYSPH